MLSGNQLYLASRSTYSGQHALVGQLMTKGICVFLPLINRVCSLSPMRVCLVILGQPLHVPEKLLQIFVSLTTLIWKKKGFSKSDCQITMIKKTVT